MSNPDEHPLIRFYLGQGTDSEGRTLREIQGWNHTRLEVVHDYIQWLFPLRTRSQFNPDAPLLDDGLIARFRGGAELRGALLTSFRVMLGFYGFAYREDGGRAAVANGENWAARRGNWFRAGNHNLLRVTRILTCLDTLGLPEQARAFLAALEAVCAASPGMVGERTLGFWRGAVEGKNEG